MNEHVVKLRNLSNIILSEQESYSSLFTAIDELFQLFNKACECTYEDERLKQDIHLPEGKAIGTCWAALCVKEIMRTRKFLQGIYQAIQAAKSKFPGVPLRILYAGTGPFATLAVPFTALFSPEDIQFTLLEINPESYRMLFKVLDYFDCRDYVASAILCDATKYCPEHGEQFHIIISETMQQALIKEPQVSITMKLLPYLIGGGILIPENIRVSCAVMNMKMNNLRMQNPDFNEAYYYNLGTALELNKELELNYPKDLPFCEISFPIRYFQIPEQLSPDYNKLYLITKISIFQEVALTDWQCSLTLPYPLKLSADQLLPGKRFGLQYTISDSPHYKYYDIESARPDNQSSLECI